MNIIQIINILQLIILAFIALSCLYFFVFALAGLFGYRNKKKLVEKKNRKIAVLIPAYKEDEVILDVAKDALKQDYKSEDFDVIIIADSFRRETLNELRKLDIKLVEVSFEKSTKAKALNKAMTDLPSDYYELAVILDADNVMAIDFLTRINERMNYGYTAVQVHRTAKNQNTPMAVLDAISEEINNHIFRKGHRTLGLSSAIIGSGMAFEYNYFKRLMKEATAVGGFDKEIELKMLKEGHLIEYEENAWVLDEKVQKTEVFAKQRRRWLSAQLLYFRKDFFSALTHLFKYGNIDYFDKVIQFIQPPRILLLASLVLFTPIALAYNYLIQNPLPYSLAWLICLSTGILAFLFSIPARHYNKNTLKAMLSLPKGAIIMLMSLLKIKGANKSFIHTQHGTTDKTNNINE